MVYKYLHIVNLTDNLTSHLPFDQFLHILKGTSLMSHKILNIHLNIPTKVSTSYSYLKLSTVTGKIRM